MMNAQRPALIACLLGVAVAGPIGCANQQSTTLQDDAGMAQTMQPLQVDPALDAAQAPATSQVDSDPWPRQVNIADGTALVYLPQINSWEGNHLSFRAAVSVKKTGVSARV